MFIAGIDEAGRGPVIGPMVMAIAAIEEKDLFELDTFDIKDSKMLTPIQRRELAEVVRRVCEYEVELATPQEIDEALSHPSRNLNILEAEMAGRLIERLVGKLGALKIRKVIMDCPSVNPKGYLEDMKHRVKRDVHLEAEHKADQKYRIVGAASILAKVIRDEEIEKLKRQYGVDFGSGYPSDEKTARFVQEHYREYDFFRKMWDPYRRAAAGGAQQTLGDFSSELSHDVERKREELLKLLAEGFRHVPVKGVAEVLRLQREGVTLTLYANGKLLVQGKRKNEWERLFS